MIGICAARGKKKFASGSSELKLNIYAFRSHGCRQARLWPLSALASVLEKCFLFETNSPAKITLVLEVVVRPLTVPVFTGRKMWGNAPGPAWRTPLQGRHPACPNDPIKVPSHLSYCPVKTSPACHTPREGYASLSVCLRACVQHKSILKQQLCTQPTGSRAEGSWTGRDGG